MKLAISLLLASSFWMGNAIAEESNLEAFTSSDSVQEEALEADLLNEQSFVEEQSNPNPLSFDFNALDESLMRDRGSRGRGGHHNGGHHGGNHNGNHNGHWNGHHGHHGGWHGNRGHRGRHWRPIPRLPFPRLATTCFAKNVRNGLTFRVRGFGPSWDLQNQAVRFCKRNSARPNACRPIGCRR